MNEPGSTEFNQAMVTRDIDVLAVLVETTSEVIGLDAAAIDVERSLKDLGASSIERSDILMEVLHKAGIVASIPRLRDVAGRTLRQVAETFELWLSQRD